MSLGGQREEQYALFSREVRGRVQELVRLASYARIEQRCREDPPADFKACMQRRLQQRGELLAEMSAYLAQNDQAGCYAECAMFRHEMYKKPRCVLDCQAKVYAGLREKLGELSARCAALGD